MEQEKFVIQGLGGERTLAGTIKTNGSKNDAVQAIAAAFLFHDSLTLSNLPQIDDVDKMLTLVENLGGRVTRRKRSARIIPPNKSKGILNRELAKKIRASILFTGPLLSRYGSVTFPHPGGCVIGERPIDFFLTGFRAMGAKIIEDDRNHIISTPAGGLIGTEIFFRNVSVTATETFIFAATLARGQTVLKNCASEPEIENLGQFLISAGAKISGLGTSTITINGGDLLTGGDQFYSILPDRIEAGSFLILAALAGKKITVTDCEPAHLESLIHHLKLAGVTIKISAKSVIISNSNNKPFRSFNLKTHEYPGFPTDLQAPLSVLFTQARGQSTIFETIFGGRLLYLETLNRMGAQTKILNPHEAAIDGPTSLKGKEMESPDLRAGLAYVLAGIIARGETIVHNIHHIDRGYERIDKRLQALGLKIKRC